MARDPNQAENSKQKIIESAIKEFAKAGYHNATIANIVSNANFSPRTFYIYFESKESLYKMLIEDWKNKVIQKFTLNKENPDYDTVINKRWLDIFGVMMENPEYTKAVYFLNPFVEEVRNELLQSLKQIITWEQDNGLIRKEIRTDIMAESILATIERIFLKYLLPEKEGVDVIARELSFLYVNGSRPR